MVRVIRPPQFDEPLAEFVVFLAGPIQGAPDWQSEAIKLFQSFALPDSVLIACPRREKMSLTDFSDQMYYDQINWEHHYLDLALMSGVTMFWLAKEAVHDCKRAYAQTTRFELGEAMVKHAIAAEQNQLKAGNLVVGIEPGFTNERYLRYTLEKKGVRPLWSSLEKTCLDVGVLLSNMSNRR